MRMPYWMRIVLGTALGLGALYALWRFVGITWITASASALVAAMGFLGSYFLWSADRPEEGYEQVLFDRPNTILSTILILAFAGLGVGSGFLPSGSAAPTPADDLYAMRAEYQSISDGYVQETLDAEAATEALNDLRAEADVVLDRLEALPADARKDLLIEAYDHLTQAILYLKTCASGQPEKCVDARLAAADAEAALARSQAST